MIQLRELFSLILVVVVVALVCPPSRGQSNVTGAFYNKPAELKLEPTTRRHFSSYRRQSPGEDFAFEGFYPIGWSRDGKFAYYFEPDGGDCDCYLARLLILDLKVDKVLWSFDYDSDSLEDAQKEGKPYSFDTLWVANQQLFSEKLRENGIAPQTKFLLSAFPIHYKGDRLTASLRTRQKPGLTEEERHYGIVGRATLQLTSSRNGTKTILDHSYPETLPLYVGLVGYLKSPFEPRIAATLIEIYRGWEGPPHTGHTKIVGANLETGFK